MSEKQFKTWLRHRLEALASHCEVGKGAPKKKLEAQEINRRLQALAEESDRRTPGKKEEAKKNGVLSQIGKRVAVEVAAKHTPSEYFVGRKGLYVWSDFNDRIVAKAAPTKAGASFKLNSFKLQKAANDAEIENSLPKKHLFSESDVCAVVSELISKQPNGEEGLLQNNGYANLFYTKDCVVFVFWISVRAVWYVSTWLRDDSQWIEDGRVFSPAN